MSGTITWYTGPMFSDKTTSMMKAVEKRHIANKAAIVVKYKKDTRYDHLAVSGGVVSHAGIEYSSVRVVYAKRLMNVYDEISEYDCVGVDEIQFFDDCIEVLQMLAGSGIEVYCAGLDGNFKGKPFKRMGEMVAITENIIKLKAVCMNCSGEASFTHRIGEGDEEVDIGGSDKYYAACRSCMWPNNTV